MNSMSKIGYRVNKTEIVCILSKCQIEKEHRIMTNLDIEFFQYL